MSIFEWSFYTGFTVSSKKQLLKIILHFLYYFTPKVICTVLCCCNYKISVDSKSCGPRTSSLIGVLTVCMQVKTYLLLKGKLRTDGKSRHFCLAIIVLTLNAPITTKVVCFSHLLKYLKSLYGKQCGPRSDCSYRSSLF